MLIIKNSNQSHYSVSSVHLLKYLDKRNRGMAVRAMDIRINEYSNIPILPYPDYRFSYVRLLKVKHLPLTQILSWCKRESPPFPHNLKYPSIFPVTLGIFVGISCP